jgi:hypothetical protein
MASTGSVIGEMQKVEVTPEEVKAVGRLLDSLDRALARIRRANSNGSGGVDAHIGQHAGINTRPSE